MSLPILIGMMAQMMLNIIDGIYAGHLGMEASVAILNYGFPLFYLLFAFFNGLSIGTNSVLARYLGAKKEAEAENALGQIIWICLALFALVIVVYPLAMPRYLVFLKANAETTKLTHDFMTYLFVGMPFILVSLSLGGGLRAEGNMRTLATSQMLGVLANILIAPFYIFGSFHVLGTPVHLHGLGLGVKGAGLATTTANGLAALYIIRFYASGKSQLRWRWKPSWATLQGVVDIFRVGSPSSISQILIGVNWMIMTRLASRFGDSAVAAIGIGGRLDLMSVFPSLAVMASVLTLVGQNYGAGLYDRVRATVRVGLLTAFLGLSSLAVVVFTLRHGIINLFHQDVRTSAAALHYLSFQCLGYGLVGVNICASGAFQGLGRGLPYLFLTSMRLLVIALPLAYVFSQHLGEYGLHYSPVMANLVTAAIGTVWILTAVRKLSPAAATTVRVAE